MTKSWTSLGLMNYQTKETCLSQREYFAYYNYDVNIALHLRLAMHSESKIISSWLNFGVLFSVEHMMHSHMTLKSRCFT